MKTKLVTFALALSALILTPLAKADSIVFESHVGNTYTYDLEIDTYSATFLFDGFVINGLSGVTNAQIGGDLATLFNPLGGISFTSTSVSVGTLYGQTLSKNAPYDIGTLTITSDVGPGPVNFVLDDSNGAFCGTLVGPADPPAAVPEPSSLALLGTGLFAAAGIARRKIFS